MYGMVALMLIRLTSGEVEKVAKEHQLDRPKQRSLCLFK